MSGSSSAFAVLNRFGNWIFPTLLRFLLKVRLTDILSGFRVMTRDFVRGVPIAGSGFEIEAELTVKAIERGYRLAGLSHRWAHPRIRRRDGVPVDPPGTAIPLCNPCGVT